MAAKIISGTEIAAQIREEIKQETASLKEKSVWISPFDRTILRAVTHRDVSAEDMAHAVEAFRQIAEA